MAYASDVAGRWIISQLLLFTCCFAAFRIASGIRRDAVVFELEIVIEGSGSP